jgi:SAM-dependent methyltransferase
MSELNRYKSSLITRVFRAIKSLVILILDLIARRITLLQFFLDLQSRVTIKLSPLKDDFDWKRYPSYYKQELKSISRLHTLKIENGNFLYQSGRLKKIDATAKDLHPNHLVLYEVVLGLRPKSVLEVGCGGGDHLANIHQLSSGIKLSGIDRSETQFLTFRERHPHLEVNTFVLDVSTPHCQLVHASLVYTQAVLMHISENDGRFMNALNYVFSSATDTVVMVENWTQHNFFTAIYQIQEQNVEWRESFMYIVQSEIDVHSSALIVSKKELKDLTKALSYEQFLAGRSVVTH